MTRTRTLSLAAAVALVAAGCGSETTCNDATPPIARVPTACTAVVGQPLPVPINTCPKCDQGTPSCDVRAAGGGVFFLEPVAEVCDPTSCPIPNLETCEALATRCTLTAAMTAGLNPAEPYTLNIVTETGSFPATLTVVAVSGTTPGCTGSATP